MCGKGFVVAMSASIAAAPFHQPYLRAAAPPDPDWLIVSRWGGDAEYLTISRTGGGDGEAGSEPSGAPPAPIGLHPRRTWFGVLTDEEAGGRESLFLLVRQLPEQVPVAGRFAPAEGYVRLRAAEDGTLRLTAVAREGGAAADGAGEAIPPPAGDAAGLSWTITAERRPWAGECVDCPR